MRDTILELTDYEIDNVIGGRRRLDDKQIWGIAAAIWSYTCEYSNTVQAIANFDKENLWESTKDVVYGLGWDVAELYFIYLGSSGVINNAQYYLLDYFTGGAYRPDYGY